MALTAPVKGKLNPFSGLWALVTGSTDEVVALEADATGALRTSTAPAAPAAADVLSGSATATGTLVTVPAGRTWVGEVTVSATVVVAAEGAAQTASAIISVAGTGAEPSGDVGGVVLHAPASNTGAPGTGDSGQVTFRLTVVADAGSAATIDLTATSTSSVLASANGQLV